MIINENTNINDPVKGKLKLFYSILSNCGFYGNPLTNDDYLFSNVITNDDNINLYEIILHIKPFGYSINFIFNYKLKFRAINESSINFANTLEKLLNYLYEFHNELFKRS